MGKYNPEKSGPIQVGLTTLRTKKWIMSNRKELWGARIYLDDDQTKETREKEKVLKPMMMEKREQGFHAVIRLGKLYAERVEYDEETAKVMEQFMNDKRKHREEKWKATKAKL